MKMSKKISKQVRSGLIFAGLGIGVLLSYQNCGTGFAPDESLRQSSTGEQSAEEAELLVGGEKQVMLDDMIVTEDQYRVFSNPPQFSIAGSHLTLENLRPWPNGVITIQFSNAVLLKYGATFDQDVFERVATAQELGAFKATVRTACDRLAAVANIRCDFVSTDLNRYFNKEVPSPTVVTMNIGAIYRGGPTDVTCGGSPGCATLGGPGTIARTNPPRSIRPWMVIKQDVLSEVPLVLHELGHVLGLDHEHQRSDRDTFLEFNPGYPADIKLPGVVEVTPFDFGSIMAYKYGSSRWPQYAAPLLPVPMGGFVRSIRPEFNADHIREILVGGHSGHNPIPFTYRPVALPTVRDVETIVKLYGLPQSMTGRASCSLSGQTIPHGSYLAVYKDTFDSQIDFCAVEARACTNGTLSGSGTKLRCDMNGVAPPPPATVNTAPTGYIDVATAQMIAGWALDPDSKAQSVTVSLYVGGMKDAGGSKLGEFVTNKARPDVNAALAATGSHGFEYPLAANADVAGKTIFLYAKDLQTGLESYIGNKVTTAAPVDPIPQFTCAANQQPSITGMNSTTGDGTIRFNLVMPACSLPSKGTYELSVDGGVWMAGTATSPSILPQTLAVNQSVCSKASCQVRVRMVHINPTTGVELLRTQLAGTYTVTKTTTTPPVAVTCLIGNVSHAFAAMADGRANLFVSAGNCSAPAELEVEVRMGAGAWVKAGTFTLPVTNQIVPIDQYCSQATCSATARVNFKAIGSTTIYNTVALPGTMTITKPAAPPAAVTCPTSSVSTSFVNLLDGRGNLFVSASNCSTPAALEVEVQLGSGAWQKAGTYVLPITNQLVPMGVTCTNASCLASARVNFKAIGSATVYQTFAIPGTMSLTTAQCTYAVGGGPVVQPGGRVTETVVCGALPVGAVVQLIGTHKAPGSSAFAPQIDTPLAIAGGRFSSVTDNIDYKLAGTYRRHLEVRRADGSMISRFPASGEVSAELVSALQCPFTVGGGNPLPDRGTLTLRLGECSYPPSGAKVYIMVNKNGAKLDLFPDPITQYELGFFEKAYLNNDPTLQGDYEFWIEVKDQSGTVILMTPKILRKVLPGSDFF
jgi:hypothetical protein